MKYSSMQAAFDADDFKELVRLGIESGTPNKLVRIPDGTRVSLLHLMVFQDSAFGAKLMLDNGADPDVLSSNGETPLHNAVISDSVELAEVLLESGANIDARRKGTNETPIIMALLGERRELARFLVDRGADLDFTDSRGMSARLIMAAKKFL